MMTTTAAAAAAAGRILVTRVATNSSATGAMNKASTTSKLLSLRHGGRGRLVVVPRQAGSSSRLYVSNTNKTKASIPTSTNTANTTAATTSTSTTQKEQVPLLETILACTGGLMVVAGGSYLVEKITADSCPTYDPNKTRFDQTTFLGRYCTMILKCDPLLLTYTQNDCHKAKEMIDHYKTILLQTNSNNINNIHHELWEAQRICNASIHPDTGNVIPRPFRVSGFVPYNGPISIAMVASSTTPTLLFWNWINQSQNAMVNYYNRNACTPLSNETLIKSYVAAVSSALVVAFGLSTFVQKRFSPNEAKKLLRFVAFPSAVVASSLNCYIVRSPEIQSGIPLMDHEGNVILSNETSIVAAKRGVYETTASRAILQMPVFFLPPLLLSSVFKSTLIKKPHLATPMTTFLLLVSFGFGFPATVAVFPQIREISTEDCEEKYHHLINSKTNQPYTKLYYNKGL